MLKHVNIKKIACGAIVYLEITLRNRTNHERKQFHNVNIFAPMLSTYVSINQSINNSGYTLTLLNCSGRACSWTRRSEI